MTQQTKHAATDKPGFVLYKDLQPILDKLTVTQAGHLFKAIYEYQNGKSVSGLDPVVEIAFISVTSHFKRDDEKYSQTCVSRRESGRKGGLANQANARSAKQIKQSQANQADIERDIDREIGIETERGTEKTTPLTPKGELVSSEDIELSHSKQKAPAKKEEYTAAFEEFWAAYPRKKGKGGAFRSWKRNKPDVAEVLSAIEAQKNGFDWQKDGGQFIPHPQTWLNNSCWLDEASESPPPGSTAPVNAENI